MISSITIFLKFLPTLIIISLFLQQDSFSQEIPSFPGAEGYGSQTPGGRGGKIIFVKNLNDDGPGSLREACEMKGPRIIIFKTGGTIELKRDIVIKNPYITIAGQTAPGDGILLKGAGLHIYTHDVIIRGIRIRVGDNIGGPYPGNRDALRISNSKEEIYNIIIDHSSFSWAVDENIDIYYNTRDITIQWSIISEGLRYSIHPKGEHSCGILIGGDAKRISIHHNLFAHNNRRNPVANRGSLVEVINNLIYNWGLRGATTFSSTNIIGNYFLPGPDRVNRSKGIKIIKKGNNKVFAENNLIIKNGSKLKDRESLIEGKKSSLVNFPIFPLSNVKIDPVQNLPEMILNNVGAIIPRRDVVDRRVISSVRMKTGKIIDSQNEVGGWPEIDAGSPLPDWDNDGMPDEWEIQNGLNPKDPSDASLDKDNNGYTNIEEYLNHFFLN